MKIRVAAGIFLALLTAACADRPLDPQHSTLPTQVVTSSQEIVRGGLHVGMPDQPRAWDDNDSELAAEIERQSGRATIAFKAPSSPRLLDSAGYRAPVPRWAIDGGFELLERRGVEFVIPRRESSRFAHVRISGELAAAIRHHPLIDYIEPDVQIELASAPTVRSPVATTQSIPWGIQMVNAPSAWAYSTGAGVRVAILDSGHQQGHVDLPYVSSMNCSGLGGGGCSDDSTDGHGTHVMGIALARDDSIGVVGVAPGVEGINTFSYNICDASSCSVQNLADGIEWGIDQQVDVINMSLAADLGNLPLSEAVAEAWEYNDIILVAASGNTSGTCIKAPCYPAAYPQVIGVSGVDQSKDFHTRALKGSHVAIAAPFSAFSTVPTDSWATLNGTSMASPHVAGAAALVRARFPSWSNEQVRSRLFTTAEDLGPEGWDEEYGWGLLNAAAAVGDGVGVQIDGPRKIEYSDWYDWTGLATSGSGSITYAWYEWTYSEQCEEYGTPGLVGTGSTYGRTVERWEMPFKLMLEVTSGSEVESTTILVDTKDHLCIMRVGT